jgi:TRAF3-interacting protein 1
MSEESIKKTIELLSKVVTKTPLTPKLLSKPPFRYLHDLFSEIIRTGVCTGLYTEFEQNSENVKDKEGKLAYLQKIINCISFATGVEVRLNPLKVVAGLEPDETNAFLHLLAKVALKKVWWI